MVSLTDMRQDVLAVHCASALKRRIAALESFDQAAHDLVVRIASEMPDYLGYKFTAGLKSSPQRPPQFYDCFMNLYLVPTGMYVGFPMYEPKVPATFGKPKKWSVIVSAGSGRNSSFTSPSRKTPNIIDDGYIDAEVSVLRNDELVAIGQAVATITSGGFHGAFRDLPVEELAKSARAHMEARLMSARNPTLEALVGS